MGKKKTPDLPLLFDTTPYIKQRHPDDIDIDGLPDLPPPPAKKFSPVVSPVVTGEIKIGTPVRHKHRPYLMGLIDEAVEIEPGTTWFKVRWECGREPPKLYFPSELIPLSPPSTGELTGETTGEKTYQWVEIYQRQNYQYYRYCYGPTKISPAKKIHIPGGNISSPVALARKSEVESAIANSKPPLEIVAMISTWQRRG